MSRVVFDSSVILALLFREPLKRDLSTLLTHVVVSSVNIAEVMSKLVQGGMAEERAWVLSKSLAKESFAFDEEQSRLAGALWTETRQAGLSLGDRACLALGLTLKLPVYTVDRVWGGLAIGVEIHVVR